MLEYVNDTDKTLEFTYGNCCYGVVASGIAKGTCFTKKKVWYKKKPIIKEINFDELPNKFKETYKQLYAD